MQLQYYSWLISKVSLVGSDLLVDPDSDEESGVGGVIGEVTVGYLPSLQQLVACQAEGPLESEALGRAVAAATQQASIILPAIQQELVQSLKQKQDKQNQK